MVSTRIRVVVTAAFLGLVLGLLSGLRMAGGAGSPLVVFDESHLPYISAVSNVSGGVKGFDLLAEFLESNGFRVDALPPGSVISKKVLEGVSVFVLVPCRQNYSASDIDIILDWVRSGGSLLILGEYDHYDKCLLGIARRVGFFFVSENFSNAFMNIAQPHSYTVVPYYPVFGPSLMNTSNSVMHGISRIEMYSVTSIAVNKSIHYVTLIWTSRDAYWFDTLHGVKGPSAAREPVAILIPLGKGVVAVIGDTSMWVNYDIDHDGTPSLYDSDNSRFAKQLFSYLAGHSSVGAGASTFMLSRFLFIMIFLIIVLFFIVFLYIRTRNPYSS